MLWKEWAVIKNIYFCFSTKEAYVKFTRSSISQWLRHSFNIDYTPVILNFSQKRDQEQPHRIVK